MAHTKPTHYARIIPPRDKKDPRPESVVCAGAKFRRIQSSNWRETWYGVEAVQVAKLKAAKDERGIKIFEVLTAVEWEAEALRVEQAARRQARPAGPQRPRTARPVPPLPAEERPVVNVEDEDEEIEAATTVTDGELDEAVESAAEAAKSEADTEDPKAGKRHRGRARS